MSRWVDLYDLPYQRIVIPTLPPTTNHGYMIVGGGRFARMIKTKVTKDWEKDTKALLDTLNLKKYQGRVLLIIEYFVSNFRADVNGRSKFVEDVLQGYFFKNDNQMDCSISKRIRVLKGQEHIAVTAYSIGEHECEEFYFPSIRLKLIDEKKIRTQSYKNLPNRRK